MEKEKLKKVVRHIIVIRKVMKSISHIEAVKAYRDAMAIDLVEYAKEHGLGCALVTGKF